ncbi:hypothetical protein NDU88_005130 [Pleurodeles waltl]|uniref:Uncharacterized protein n=1 Tax=Pleurodeles waltl TaxID=8319 RepID=A0AAV7WXD6_PLEWA|nr:hypothetical protein NDU88_005130 [Pleurodeles waltl]
MCPAQLLKLRGSSCGRPDSDTVLSRGYHRCPIHSAQPGMLRVSRWRSQGKNSLCARPTEKCQYQKTVLLIAGGIPVHVARATQVS